MTFPPGQQAWIYCDVQGCYLPDLVPFLRELTPDAVHVGLFTHLHANDPRHFRPLWSTLDGVVHMARRYEHLFLQWFTAEQMTVLCPGEPTTMFACRPVRLGICQRGGFEGKGAQFLPEVLHGLPASIREGLHLTFIGKDWKDQEQSYHGVAACYLGEEYDQYPSFFAAIDYVLIPSLWEGGPMGLLEALASGLPVIAANVGWVPDLLHGAVGLYGQPILKGHPANVVFAAGDVPTLQAILTRLVDERQSNRALVAYMTYRAYADGLLRFVQHIQQRRGPRDG